MGSACPPSTPWHQTSAWAPRAPRLPDGIHGDDASGRAAASPPLLHPAPPSPALSRLSSRALRPVPPSWYCRGGHMPLTSPPRTRGTRSGTPVCGAGGGPGTGDTSPGTPGPRSGVLRVAGGQGAGPRAQPCSGEGHVALSPTLPALLWGRHARPGAWPFLLSCSEGCGPGRPSFGRWLVGELGQTVAPDGTELS